MTDRADDRCAGSDEHEQERPEELREQAPPFQSVVVELRGSGELEGEQRTAFASAPRTIVAVLSGVDRRLG